MILEIQVALDKTEELRKKIEKEVEGLWVTDLGSE